MDNGSSMSSPVSTLSSDDEGVPIYSRKAHGRGGTGWDKFTLIIDVEKKDICYNCLLCLPAGNPIIKATHIHSGKGKTGQKGVFTLNLASSGVKKHLKSQHGMSVDEDESSALSSKDSSKSLKRGSSNPPLNFPSLNPMNGLEVALLDVHCALAIAIDQRPISTFEGKGMKR
mmetsp:Transcript_21540/g.44922  ORF Transcript_21540/g.44922 Transcript_21540/m.44922 type:complete len:172 (-) Transcript_21540:139-654(-)